MTYTLYTSQYRSRSKEINCYPRPVIEKKSLLINCIETHATMRVEITHTFYSDSQYR